MSLNSGLPTSAPTLAPASTDKLTQRSVQDFPGNSAKARGLSSSQQQRLCSPEAFGPLLQRLFPAALLLLAVQEFPLRVIAGTAQLQPGKPALRRFSGNRFSPSPMEIPPNHYPATRAAGVAANYINYQHGGPHRLFGTRLVSEARLENIPGAGHKYHLKFEVEEYVQKISKG